MQRIVYLESDSVIAAVRRPAFAHDWVEYPMTAPDQVVERLHGATIAIVNKVPLPAAAVDALPDLKMVAVAATGTNIVDLNACRRRGIVVSNIRGYADHTVPEHALALLLALSRNLIAWRATVQAGRWQQSDQFCLFDHPIRDLHGATLGLIGSGSLGNGVARLAEAFGMRVLRAEHKGAPALRPGYTDFAEVLREADAVSLHCPLTPQTQGLIGEAELRAMKSTALLINTARGGLIDTLGIVRQRHAGRKREKGLAPSFFRSGAKYPLTHGWRCRKVGRQPRRHTWRPDTPCDSTTSPKPRSTTSRSSASRMISTRRTWTLSRR